MNSLKPNFALLLSPLVSTTSALLGIPDVVLQSAALWVRIAGTVVFTALHLIQ